MDRRSTEVWISQKGNKKEDSSYWRRVKISSGIL